MKRYSGVLLVIGLIAIFFIPWLWYRGGSEIIIGGDLTFPLKPAEYFLSIFSLWRRVYTGVDNAISLTTLPFYAPMAVASALGASLQLVQKIHFGLWLAVPAISIYYLAGVVFKDLPAKRVAQLVAVSVWLFNTYEVVWADSARMAVWVGLPLMLGFFIEGLRAKKWLPWAAGIALASITTSTAAANPPMFLVMLAVFLFWLIFHLATQGEDRKKEGLIRIGQFIGVSLLLTVLINLYWVIPYSETLFEQYRGALGGGLGGINMKDWLDPVSTNTSLLNVLRLEGAWDWYGSWQGEPYVPAAYPYQHNIFYLVWSVLIPILAFAASLTKDKRHRPLILWLTFLTLLGLFASAGSHPPTGLVYTWLVKHFSFLSIYRSPWYKFSIWTVLGYSLLIGYLLARMYDFLSRQKRLALLAPTIIVIFLIANLIYSSGLVLGKVFPRKEERVRLHSAHVTFPDYFGKAADWINGQAGDFRILQLPAQEAFNYRWGLGTLMDMSLFTFAKPTIWWPEQTGSASAKPGGEALAKVAYQELYRGRYDNLSRLFGLLNIKYLLEKTDIDYSFYGGPDSPQFVTGKISDQGLKLAHEVGPWQFFAVSEGDQRSLFYPTAGFVKTSPKQDGFLQAILGPTYNPRFTYGETTNLPAGLATGSLIAPLTAEAKVDSLDPTQIDLPLDVERDGQYLLAGRAGEEATVALDGQTLKLTTEGEQVSTKVDLRAGRHMLGVKNRVKPANLIDNPSFESGIWDKVIDASQTRAGEAKISGEVISDAKAGTKAVRLSSASHSAAIRKGIDQFESNRTYLISFDYRWRAGQAPKFAVWQEGALAIEPEADLAKSSDWQRATIVFTPRPLTTGAFLFLYADPGVNGPTTTVDYDNVEVIKLPKLVSSLSASSLPTVNNNLPTIEYTRRSSTDYLVSIKGATADFILNFLEEYNPMWQAQIQRQRLGDENHFIGNNYANSWYIKDKGDYEIHIWFKGQRIFTASALASLVGLIICLYFISQKRK